MIARYLARSLMILPLILNAACGRDERTAAQAKDFFHRHEQTLGAMVSLISRCEGKGVISIYPDGHVLGTASGTVKCPSTKEISARLKAANILWVNVSGDEPYGRQGPFGAMFVLSSHGIVGSGYGNAIYYFPELEKNPFGDSVPLKGMPGHWFITDFRKISGRNT